LHNPGHTQKEKSDIRRYLLAFAVLLCDFAPALDVATAKKVIYWLNEAKDETQKLKNYDLT